MMKFAILVASSTVGLFIAAAIFVQAYVVWIINGLSTGTSDIDYTVVLILVAGVLVFGLSLYGLVSAARSRRAGKKS